MLKLLLNNRWANKMKLGIHFGQASTQRGLVWIIAAIVGAVFIYQGKPIDQLLLLAGGVAGGLGLLIKD
jgi:hypothetical protein